MPGRATTSPESRSRMPTRRPSREQVAAGTYQATATAGAADMTSPATLSATVTLASALVGPPAPATAEPATLTTSNQGHGSWWIVPAVLVALVVGGGGGAWLTWRLARRAGTRGGG